ncbi:MAG: excinuclease ABC subunit A [Bacteroidetes bacterium GWF2_42_66]|nr:MAG: excinuclease ABC subunit A [Bacteroidetes bacterium GWA2_42_15]OFX99519.1 MAG: excinuclease ABC subunit A [Bacteroidetes bacterium GWE2_42_39]OFY47186.1 MAG: excinuclease ABC subunit A [Bacteroidetes bacterium GWF2_42_66]HBL76858.1 excinuclease ABC subunit A [Prolixibacteraceae bacterium]HCR90493.1 excinuclease ABC subunit A [Prolixibacteraceae bacterium]
MNGPENNHPAIQIKGARVHNLKNINLNIERNKFVVITGLSGSGKSSLAFDTLYAEGQRRYVESLSSYARQFLGRIHKPEVDYIKGIPPAIAIEQKVNTRNPRSTVGTSTEIYDYLKLLFARIGRTISPVSGKEVKQHHVDDVVKFITGFPEETHILICSPLRKKNGRSILKEAELLLQQGFTRLEINSEIKRIDEILKSKETEFCKDSTCNLVIDRLSVQNDDDAISRLADSVQTAFFEGHGECVVKVFQGETTLEEHFSNLFEADGIEFEEPSVHLFSFNNPVGACPTCEGYGKVIGIDEDLVIPNKSLSIYQDAVACWKGEKMGEWKDRMVYSAEKFRFPIHKPYYELSDEQKQLLWTGNSYFEGLNSFFKMLEENTYKIQYRVMLSRYRGKTVCPECRGSRLKKEAGYVKIGNTSIQDLVLMPVNELKEFFSSLQLKEHEHIIAKRILIEIQNRIDFLCDVGLGYLTLNRLSSTLSGGESQRINLATSLGSSLVGSMYILDEPSIGLHTRDTDRLIGVLRKLQKIGNSVIVVEHDEEIILAADEIIDIGPLAGRLGGEVVFQGNHEQLKKSGNSLTAKYLTGKEKIEVPKIRRKWNNYIELIGARENNLKNISAKFPLNTLCVVTGVSGSGKSSLVTKILYPALAKMFGGFSEKTGHHDAIKGDLQLITSIEFVDQNPIGKSSRSNPVTYLKAYDEIRKLFSEQKSAQYHGFAASHFSFNVDGGRCEECQGEGEINVEMQFMADIHLVCESCKGKRFKDEILEITYKGKNIYDVLEMTVNEAIEFFSTGKSSTEKKVAKRLKPLQDVGLGYVKLGQSSSTLSGGESQRIKLASFLAKEKDSPSLFIFDEPTTGLHFHDIKKLLGSFEALLERGHSIIIIEHNLEVIKCADWVIDLGPEGGKDGGYLVFEGTPEDLVKVEKSYTGQALCEKLGKS